MSNHHLRNKELSLKAKGLLQHYESYIASLSMRKLRDERGNIYWGIDEDIRDRLRSRLMRAVLSFKV